MIVAITETMVWILTFAAACGLHGTGASPYLIATLLGVSAFAAIAFRENIATVLAAYLPRRLSPGAFFTRSTSTLWGIGAAVAAVAVLLGNA